ncbi:phage tail tape measure protein [Tritonibacter horizontis]|uniref:Uncharacterized protein n=1 Tax=Tritonibacter horizontis TaxID=1768241 RepID=A0A132BTW3_9RHOB|nr:hypothetical protein [Tritonibacter horizontis]KUP91803.1 hypothetical protein TRIHO_33340 [Tritonibacter horizontis]
MSAVIGALRGVLSMDSAAFETGAKRAKATMGTVERRMGVLASKMEGAGRRMALGLTLPMAGAATIAVRASLKIIDAQAKTAQSLNTTVASMQVLQRAADLSGVSMGEVEQATLQLTKRLSQAAGGTGTAVKALDRLQLSASQLQALPLDQRLEKIQGALAEFVPEAERAAVASDLFGSRAGLIFTRVDSAALRTAAEDVTRFGVAISEVDADQIELTNDAISRMGLAGRGLANQVTVALAPALQGLSDRVADVATWFNGLSDRTKQFIATGALIAGTVGPAALALGLVLKVTLPLGLAMGGLISTVALAPVRFAAAARSAIALEMALGATSTKAAVAGVAIKGLQRGLGLLRGAIISTGIGALVVGAGYLAMKFNNLVVATGSWGAALQALGDLAGGIWTGIKSGAQAIGPALKAVWSDVRAGFVTMIAGLQQTWAGFLHMMTRGAQAAGQDSLALTIHGYAVEASSAVHGLTVQVEDHRAAAEAARQTAAKLAKEGWGKASEALKTLILQMDSANAELDAGDDSADALKDRLSELGEVLDDSSGGGVAGGLKKTGETAKEAATELRGPLTSAVEGVSRAFGDWISGGLRDFKSLWDGIRDAAKRGLSDLASQFAQNQLKLVLGISLAGSGTAANAAGGLISGGGGGGLLSGLLGGSGVLSGIGSGIGSGLGGVLSGGGLGSSFANLGGLVTGTSGGLGAIGAALPAIGILLGGVALLSKAFSRKFEYSALEGTVGTEGFDGRARDFYKGGWFRSDKTVYRDLDADLDAALDQQVMGITTGLLSMSEALGLGADALEEFEGYRFSLKTTGRSQAQIQEAIAKHMAAASDEMAALILGTDDLARSGEGAAQTLSRLSTSLLTVNDAMDLLGQTSFDVSLLGADLASDLVDAFGGVEPFSTAITGYFGSFYTEGERSEVVMRRLRDAFEELGVAMPASRAGFRAMVESLDLSTESGQALYAQLIQLSGAMDEVLPQVGAFTAEIAGMADQIGGEIGTRIDGVRDMVTASQAAAEEWRRAAEGLRGVMSDLLGTDLSAASSAQRDAAQRARLDAGFAGVKAGDAEAAAALPDLARDYLRGARDTAGSDLEYRRIAAEVQGQLREAAGIAELESGNDAVLAGLYRQQIEVLTSLGSFLQLEGLTADQVAGLSDGVQALAADWDGTVAAFETSLSGLEQAIAAAEAFSYDDLVGALDVAVALEDDAPRWLRRLVAAADDGIRTTLDFIIQRDDLTPADRWIATNALSHHVATLDLVMGQDLTRNTRKLALTAAADLRRRLMLDLGQDLDPETRSLVLTRSATLSRRVNVTLSKGGADTLDRLTHLSDLIGDGKGSGRLTFGGGVVLEADDVFADLARSTARLTAPMDRLREMLGDLRDAVRADRQAREDQLRITSLQARGAKAMARTGGGQDVVDQFNALRTQYGVGLTGQNSSVTVGARGYITPSFDGYKGGDVSGFWAALKETFGTSIIGDVFQARNAQTSAAYERAQKLRGQIRALGGIPAFARGGAHQGGARIVGEGGWEVEHTGPSRIHSHAESVAMLDNRPVVQGLQDLTRHVVAQGQVIRMLVDRIAAQVDEWNDLGLPEERS